MTVQAKMTATAATCFGAALAFNVVGQASAQRAEGLSQLCTDCTFELYAECGEKKFLEGPNFDDEGNLWMVGLGSGEILRVNAEGSCDVMGRTGGFPGGARMSRDGILYVTDRIGLMSYDTGSNEAELTLGRYGIETFSGLNDLVIDSEGAIYFTEPYGSDANRPTGRVFRLSADRESVTLVGDTFAFPNGVALSPDERTLYVAEYGANKITALPLAAGAVDPSGIPYTFAYMEGGIGPDGMIVDSDGNLYVAHFRAGEVVVYEPSGFPLGTLTLPEEAGMGSTNLVLRDGWLYVTEALQNEVWRVRIDAEQLMP